MTDSQNKLLASLETDTTTGLSTVEAARRLERDGRNELAQKKKKTLLVRFLEQFKDVMIIILLIAAGVSFAVAISEGNAKEFFEPILILLIVILNAVIGVAQENKAEKALEALQNMSSPHARVIRDGAEQVVESSALVQGDIILLEAGDFVPADALLLSSASLKCEEAALTGESVPSEKDANADVPEDAPLGDRVNMVYSGCSVTYGRGVAVVTATGMNTEMGKIAGLLNDEKDSTTPLQLKLAQMGKYLGFIALAACAIVFLVDYLINKNELLDTFMTAVSLAVSAIPEGLPAIVTVVLSIGVQRMVKRNAIIRSLPAVETLGSASIICSDKTGTLTQNKMTLVRAYTDETGEDSPISENNSEDIRKLLRCGALCCDGSVLFNIDGSETHIGDPTETSIVLAAHKNGMTKEALNEQYPRVAEIPFDSDRKMMTTIHEMDGKIIAVTKGAFDSIAPRCTKGNVDKALALNNEMSASALRVITIAIRELPSIPVAPTSEAIECDLTLLGLVGMIDPPRPEAKEAVAVCRQAGIKPVMITGDHVVTASAIAKDIGIMEEGDRALTGADLALMSDEELAAQVPEVSVFARVSPEDKIRIVKAWQTHDQIVSMTGDGVNDAPALKAADIGCAMGITGTDVAKGAADMTLTDDNFATIVKAVKEGRGIYDNIRKVVSYLLATNVAEILTVFFITLIWGVAPLLPMQLLWINLVTDSLPAIALGMEPVEKGVMNRKPRPKTESIFAHGLGMRIGIQGTLFAVLTMAAFALGRFGLGYEGEMAASAGQTLAFMTLGFIQCFHSFNMRSNHSLFKIGPFTNGTLNKAFLVSAVMMLAVCFIPPLSTIFGLVNFYNSNWWVYLVVLALAFLPVPVMELDKRYGLIHNQEEDAD